MSDKDLMMTIHPTPEEKAKRTADELKRKGEFTMERERRRQWLEHAGVYWPPRTCPLNHGIGEHEGDDSNYCHNTCAWAFRKASKDGSHCGKVRQGEREKS